MWAFVLAPEPSAMATGSGIAGIIGIILMPAYAICFCKKANKLQL